MAAEAQRASRWVLARAPGEDFEAVERLRWKSAVPWYQWKASWERWAAEVVYEARWESCRRAKARKTWRRKGF